MATLDTSKLEQQARKAYEIGRLKRAMRVLAVVIPLVALSIYICGASELACIIGISLAVASIGFLWRGEGWGKSVSPGLKAGTAAFVVPVTFHALGYCCRYDLETALCIGSGVVAGLAVSMTGMKKNRTQRTTHLIGAGLVAALAASLGCLALGIGGALGVAGGVLVTITPFAFVSFAKT